jgi:hypothetical protein
MRKVSFSQSLTFFAPPEVDNQIRLLMQNSSDEITSYHVIRWAIDQSCKTIESQGPLWMMRGLTHGRRRLAFNRYVSATGEVTFSDEYLETIREQEARSVSEMYAAGDSHKKKLPFELTSIEKNDPIIGELLSEWECTDTATFKDTGITEEQEREILHEVEEEREVQVPREVKAAKPSACDALLTLIRGGTLPDGEPRLFRAFEVLRNTRLVEQYRHEDWPGHILVTQDFLRTIQTRDSSTQDDFLRPVQWVLKFYTVPKPVIISPFEANMFLPEIRKSVHATLIIYAARVAKGMASFDNMDVYRVTGNDSVTNFAPEAMTMLNLFAGQLYFSTFISYQQLCEMIGLWDGVRDLPVRRKVLIDNFVPPICRRANGWTTCAFRQSPVPLLKAFIGMRRLGIEWSHTHMGRVLSGRFLRPEDFEEEPYDLATEMESLALESQLDSEKASVTTAPRVNENSSATSMSDDTDDAGAVTNASESGSHDCSD